MPTTYTRKGTSSRGEWSEVALNNAVKAIEQNEMGVNAAAKAFGIPPTTLKRRLKSNYFSKGSMGKPSLLGRENEKKIVAHIKKLQSRGFTPTRDSVRSMAYNLAETLKLKHNFNSETKQAGYDWLTSFLARNSELSIRQSEGVSIARAKGLNKKVVANYFKLLGDVLKDNGLFDKPGHVFNMDETGLQLNNKPGKVIAIKGSKNVTSVTSGEKGETISVLACVSGEGTFLPPVSIMKGKNLKQEFCDGMPPGAEVKMSQKSGYVNAELFFDWLRNHFTPRKPAGKVLLLLDGHTSHTSCIEMLEFAEQNDIVLMSIPPHTSHWLQPLDRAFFKSLKSNYYSACNTYMTNNPSRKITRLQFGTLLSSAWGKSANVDNGISGFKTCGIIPFELNAIPDYAFLSETNDSTQVQTEPATETRESEMSRPNKPALAKKANPVLSKKANTRPTPISDPPATARPSLMHDPLAVPGPSSKPDAQFVPFAECSNQPNTSENLTPSKILELIHPVPCASKLLTLKRRAQTVSTVLSSPENILCLKKKKEEKDLIIKIKEEKKLEREKKKLEQNEIKKNGKCTSKMKRPKLRIKKEATSSSECDDFDIDEICNDNLYESEWEEDECVGCGENYSETKKKKTGSSVWCAPGGVMKAVQDMKTSVITAESKNSTRRKM